MDSLFILLDDIMFRTPLLRFPIIMSRPRSLLSLPIPDQALDRTLHAALGPLSDPAPVILQLTFGLLALALRILPLAFFLEPFGAEHAAEAFLGGPDGLIVTALGAGWVIGGDAPLRDDGEWTEFADSVGKVFFGRRLGFGIGGLVL